MPEDTQLDADLVQIVLAEAMESLENAAATLRSLDFGPAGAADVAPLFRCFHSIKGNTAMAGRAAASRIAHRVESGLDRVRAQRRPFTHPEADALLEIVDLMFPLVEAETGWPPGMPEAFEAAFARFEPGSDSQREGPRSSALLPYPPASIDFARTEIQAGGLAVQLCPSPIISAAPSTRTSTSLAAPSLAFHSRPPSERGESEHPSLSATKLRIDAHALVDILAVAGNLLQIDERLHAWLSQHAEHPGAGLPGAEALHLEALHLLARDLGANAERLYAQLLEVQRLPVAQLTSPLERVVREVCRATGKRIAFVVQGQTLRIDKQVMQTLKDPLMHMVRNACDHGVEPPDERHMFGKPAEATLRLEFFETDETVRVELSDDGRGLRLDKIRETVTRRGLLDPAAAARLSPQELVQWIFHPGFSTVERVSELSGRGVGMDVVATSVAAAGGRLSVHTEPGQGTRFDIELKKLGSPVVDGLAVSVGQIVYLIPMKYVVKHEALSATQLELGADGALNARIDGELCAVHRLPGSDATALLSAPGALGVLTLGRSGRRVLLLVERLLGRRRAVLRSQSGTGQERPPRDTVTLADGAVGVALGIEELHGPELAVRGLAPAALQVFSEPGGRRLG